MKLLVCAALLCLACSKVVASSLSAQTAAVLAQAESLQEQELDQAIQLLQAHQAFNYKDQAYVAYSLGIMHWQQHQLGEAERQLRQALALDQLAGAQEWQAQCILAEVMYQQQDYATALLLYKSLMRQAQRLTPAQQQALTQRVAHSHYQLSQWQACLAVLHTYQTQWPEPDEVVLRLLLATQLQLKQYLAARRSLESLVQLQPTELSWWQQLSQLQLQLQQPKAALVSLQLAQRQGLTLPVELLIIQAQLYAQLEMPLQSASLYARLYEMEGRREFLLQQVWQWQQAREWTKALQLWPVVIEHFPEHMPDYIRLLLQQQQGKLALMTLQSLPALKREPELLVLAIRSAVLVGESQLALDYAAIAHQLHPSDETQGWLDYLETR